MKTKVMFVILFAIVIGLILVDAVKSYTYDGEIDPNQFFTYTPVSAEPLSHNTALVLVSSEELTPKFAILCLMRIEGGSALLAYAYYDQGFIFRHYMIVAGRYIEKPLDAETEKNLRKMLNKAYGMSQS